MSYSAKPYSHASWPKVSRLPCDPSIAFTLCMTGPMYVPLSTHKPLPDCSSKNISRNMYQEAIMSGSLHSTTCLQVLVFGHYWENLQSHCYNTTSINKKINRFGMVPSTSVSSRELRFPTPCCGNHAMAFSLDFLYTMRLLRRSRRAPARPEPCSATAHRSYELVLKHPSPRPVLYRHPVNTRSRSHRFHNLAVPYRRDSMY
jgi:hypothetical protein